VRPPRPQTLEDALEVIARLLARIEGLEAEVAALKEQLRQSSQNSSRPPSTDPPTVARPPTHLPSGRRPGAQPGHEAHARALVPEAEVDQVIPLRPTQCRGCGAALRGSDPAPRRQQLVELPVVRPTITEYQWHTLTCGRCGVATTAPRPPGVPAGAFGPRLTATVAVCTGVYHLSKRTTAGLLADLFGVELAVGSITACERAASAAVATPVIQAVRHVRQQPVIHVDETGWRQRRQRAWLWVAATPRVTVFLVHARRGTGAARALLRGTAAILVTDRWSAYQAWPLARRQLCWAHLRREWVAFTERGGLAWRAGQALLAETWAIFALWHRVRAGTLSRARFQAAMGPHRRRVEAWLRRGTAAGHAKTAATCREVLALAPALWTFVGVPGVEPTNNAAERPLRPAVLWRRKSFGTHSAAGSRFAERLLTVAATLTAQRRNIVGYVTEACLAALHGTPAPSLLPASARLPPRAPVRA
jgi:transposase